MQLVIVESPTKARTLSRFLGNEYQIEASMGHIQDLPKSVLGVDVEKNFEPQYVQVVGKEKVVAKLKASAKQADTIILATDPDREGEAIASHVKDVLAQNQKSTLRLPSTRLRTSRSGQEIKNQKFTRIVFHEITKEAIEEALKNPREVDMHLVDAQTARRVLDRLVGYKLSPLLWQKVRRGLSAGRVQSVAVRLIVEREREIEKFEKERYFTVEAVLIHDVIPTKSEGRVEGSHTSESVERPALPAGRDFSTSLRSARNDNGVMFELIEINGDPSTGSGQGKIEEKETIALYDGDYTFTKTSIDTKEKADAILSEISGKPFIVADVLQKEIRRSPYPPFTTSTLTQEASRRFGFSSKRTMQVAQRLYEEGFITYHRTDSVTMAKQAVFTIRNFIEKEYGKKYVNESPRMYKTKQKLAQEAHEAIRPTYIGELQSQKSKVKSQISHDGEQLYELIWKRSVATQMAEAILEATTVLADVEGDGDGRLPHTANDARQPSDISEDMKPSSLSERRPPKVNDKSDSKTGSAFSSFAGGQSPIVSTYRFKATGSVIVFDGFLKLYPQALTEQRLPTYSQGETLQAEKINAIEHETTPPPRYNEASLIATLEENGIGRPSTYAPIISTIQDRQYVEKDPSAGSGQGRRFAPTPVGVAVNDFLVANFTEVVDIPFTAQMEDGLDGIANDGKPWQPMIADFYKPFEKKLESVGGVARVKIAVEETEEKCPQCGSNLVIRVGRFGKFMACSKFPACKFTKSFMEDTGVVCPLDGKNGGKVILKKTHRGRRFYGCSNYPTCKFAAWRLEDIKKAA